jgi:3-hydroxy-3-methylglutaryl CoA synthase
MFERRGISNRAELFRRLPAVFLHRPYHRMPHNAWALGYLFALAADGGAAHDELKEYCQAASIELASLLDEIAHPPEVAESARRGETGMDPYPQAMLVLKAFRASARYQEVVEDKMRLGGERMMELGNLYTAALFAWLAAGLTQAAEEGMKLDGQEILLMGYGSGDAAEAIPARFVPGWEQAAARTGFAEALNGAIDLNQAQYESLHDYGRASSLPDDECGGFTIDAIGERDSGPAQDYGIEYYRYRRGA